MRQIVFFTVALLFTFAYCATRFTAVGLLYCPHKAEWEYSLRIWEGIKGKFGTARASTWGIGDAQVQFYEMTGETVLNGFPDGHLGIDIHHTCGSDSEIERWGGYSWHVPLDGGHAYGFSVHDLGKKDEDDASFKPN